MANNQAAFDALVTAVQNNLLDFTNSINNDYSISNGRLSLFSAGITDADIQSLAIALKANTSLKFLQFRFNFISSIGAKAIATVLENNTSLSGIDFRGNNFGTEGAQAIATALTNSNSLTFIDLVNNSIGIAGAQAIAIALQNNTSLITIDIYGNSIGDAGAMALATALQKNTSLATLWIGDNGIGDTGAQAIVTAMQLNFSLTFMFLGSNSISTTNLNTIATLTSRNQQYIQIGPVYDNSSAFLRGGANTIQVSQGSSLALTSANLLATGINDTPITFALTQITHGEFINATTRLPITQFTQAQINEGNVEVLHDGSYYPLSYAVTANNGTVTTPPHQGAVIFTRQPNSPLLSKNNLTLARNQTTILTTDNLLASFDGVTPLPGLIFNVRNVTAGQFEMVGTTQALNTFSQASVMNGQIEFACDNSGMQPMCQLQVSDGNRTSNFVPANITFIPFTTTSTTTQPTMLTTMTTTNAPTAFTITQMPSTSFTSMQVSSTAMSSSTGTALVSTQKSRGSQLPIIPLAAGIAGGVALLGGLGLAWCLYRRRKHAQQPVIQTNQVRRNPLFLEHGITEETSVDTMPERHQTAWTAPAGAETYDTLDPTHHKKPKPDYDTLEPEPKPSTDWSTQHYDVNTQRTPQSQYDTLKNSPSPSHKPWDKKLYDVPEK